MTKLEEKLQGYKEPSSSTEQERQARAERMVRDAITSWPGFENIGYRILPKGSYVNNTNVRSDSDVDIAVIHAGFHYFNDDDLPDGQKVKGKPPTSFHYSGPDFRAELEKALRAKFGEQCDLSGRTAINVSETSSRVSIDVVPSFEYRHYYYHWLVGVRHHDGTKTYRTDGTWVVNYPDQQLKNGRKKNQDTSKRYKHQVRILKRIENELVKAGVIEELPSYFIECLVYNVPDGKLRQYLTATPLTSGLTAVLSHIVNAAGPGGDFSSWVEPNEIKALFGDGQRWSFDDAKTLALAARNHYNLG